MGVTSSSPPVVATKTEEEDLYPDLPVKKKFGETVVRLIHVKKGTCLQEDPS
jgi:hypothetical protein